MRVLFLTGREKEYSRNEVLLRAFRHFSQVDAITGRDQGSLIKRSAQVYAEALPRLLRKNYDLIFVGFYGHLLMLPFLFLKRAPVLFDAFISNYDTLAFDRKTIPPKSLRGRIAFTLDHTSCAAADRILLDTPQHAEYFREVYSIPPEKINSLPVGCNEDLFYPQTGNGSGLGIEVLYYSTYFPLHGVETVVRAAEALRSETGIHFTLIGYGPEYNRINSLVDDIQLTNLRLVPSVPLQQLPGRIASADICLGGHFGESAKAGRVIPGKIYQILAMQKALIATTTPANLSLLCHMENAFLVPPADPNALADAIHELSASTSLRQELALGGRKLYEQRCSEFAIGTGLKSIVERMLAKR